MQPPPQSDADGAAAAEVRVLTHVVVSEAEALSTRELTYQPHVDTQLVSDFRYPATCQYFIACIIGYATINYLRNPASLRSPSSPSSFKSSFLHGQLVNNEHDYNRAFARTGSKSKVIYHLQTREIT